MAELTYDSIKANIFASRDTSEANLRKQLAYLYINDNEQEQLLHDMQGKYSMILKNHGLISVGSSITEAFWFRYYLETSCKLHVLTASTGSKIKYPNKEAVANTAAKYDLWRNHNDHIEVSDSELLFEAALRKIGYIFN